MGLMSGVFSILARGSARANELPGLRCIAYCVFFDFAQRFFTSARIRRERSSGETSAHRFLPPRPAAALPPSRPSATAAGFFASASAASRAGRG
jgi:hypothetical protein